MKLETKFDILQEVLIKELDKRPARITEIAIDRTGYEYKVRYFSCDKQEFAWLRDMDLEAAF